MTEKSSIEILQGLYNEDHSIKDDHGNDYIIPEKGSLGLLALGYRGLIEWRKVKMKHKEEVKE
jgi:hypothetical protein